jgi:uncharacterized protein with PIN domain
MVKEKNKENKNSNKTAEVTRIIESSQTNIVCKKKDLYKNVEFAKRFKRHRQEVLDNGRCPICKGKLFDANDAIIPQARDATILLSCPNCELLFGRYT